MHIFYGVCPVDFCTFCNNFVRLTDSKEEAMSMALLQDKKILILGVANEKSIAWGIAKSLKKHGARLAFTYQNEQLRGRVGPLAEELGADFLAEMDVTNDAHYGMLHDTVKKEWGRVDVIVHSLAFADKQDLKGGFSETSREGFAKACDISAFSLVGLANGLKDLLVSEGSIMALTYHGSQKVASGYNVMGVAKAALEATTRYLAYEFGREKKIRVNCISAGPIRTLASSAIKGFRDINKVVEEKAPLGRGITQEDVGDSAVYLASELSKNVTGQILYVDSGISIML
jgi:enoyl-[acyl-carrier protein] reductase I